MRALTIIALLGAAASSVVATPAQARCFACDKYTGKSFTSPRNLNKQYEVCRYRVFIKTDCWLVDKPPVTNPGPNGFDRANQGKAIKSPAGRVSPLSRNPR
ncbi:MAG: hypothetical protein R3E18_08325 [Sphingomonadaceae bacterium]|nr:hypothetical protein [Sphingomonadaceae bacterium]